MIFVSCFNKDKRHSTTPEGEGKTHHTRRETSTTQKEDGTAEAAPPKGNRGQLQHPKGRGGGTTPLLYRILPYATYYNLIHFQRVELNLMMLWEKHSTQRRRRKAASQQEGADQAPPPTRVVGGMRQSLQERGGPLLLIPFLNFLLLYFVLCTLYFVLCTLYFVLCTLYFVLCTLYFVLFEF